VRLLHTFTGGKGRIQGACVLNANESGGIPAKTVIVAQYTININYYNLYRNPQWDFSKWKFLSEYGN
jgi:hypothetical protein